MDGGRLQERIDRLLRRHEIERPLFAIDLEELDSPGAFFDDPRDDICLPRGEAKGRLVVPDDVEQVND